jgi:hypothetical protein
MASVTPRSFSVTLIGGPRRVSDAGGGPDVGDLILNDEERAFVEACWIATAWRRDGVRAGRCVA